MIGWRKKSWNPERVPTVVTLCVCLCARHIFWPRNFIFGLGHEKETFGVFSPKSSFLLHLEKKMSIKSVKMKISKNEKMRFFLMSQGSFNPKIRLLGQKMWPVGRAHTDTRTHTHTQSDYCGHPFRVSWVFFFNLSSRIGPISQLIENSQRLPYWWRHSIWHPTRMCVVNASVYRISSPWRSITWWNCRKTSKSSWRLKHCLWHSVFVSGN